MGPVLGFDELEQRACAGSDEMTAPPGQATARLIEVAATLETGCVPTQDVIALARNRRSSTRRALSQSPRTSGGVSTGGVAASAPKQQLHPDYCNRRRAAAASGRCTRGHGRRDRSVTHAVRQQSSLAASSGPAGRLFRLSGAAAPARARPADRFTRESTCAARAASRRRLSPIWRVRRHGSERICLGGVTEHALNVRTPACR